MEAIKTGKPAIGIYTIAILAFAVKPEIGYVVSEDLSYMSHSGADIARFASCLVLPFLPGHNF